MKRGNQSIKTYHFPEFERLCGLNSITSQSAHEWNYFINKFKEDELLSK